MPEWMKDPWIQDLVTQRLPTLGVALAILVGGWLVASVLHKGVYAALRKTTIDDKLAELLGVETGGEHGARIERIVARALYYVLLAFVFVAFFSYLGIQAVTQPLVTLLSELASAVPNLLKAALIGLAGFLAANAARRLVLVLMERSGLEKRVRALAGDMQVEEEREAKKKGKKVKAPEPLAQTLADVAYWFILVVTAIPVLESLKISALSGPLSGAFAGVAHYLPKVAGAAVLLLAGYVVSRIARAVVSGVLGRVGVDRAAERLGLGAIFKEQPLSKVLGTLVFVFVLLQFAIGAVGRLELAEISVPLSRMLESIYGYLPKLLVGALLVLVGAVVGRLAGNVAARLAAAVGLNSLVAHLGLFQPAGEKAEVASEKAGEGAPTGAVAEPTASDELVGVQGIRGIRTPADVVGLAAFVVVVLLFSKQALTTLELSSFASMLERLIDFLPHVVAAFAVLGAGLWAGAFAHRRIDELTLGSTDRLVRGLGLVAHVVAVVFAAMVALQQLGVGAQLIAIAFGLLLGAVCLALALAFGLGGRDVASKILAREYDKRAR
jgi:hypothetical protein